MKKYRLASYVGMAAAALAFTGCALDEGAGEGDFNEQIVNANPWDEAPDFVKDSLVIVRGSGTCSGTIIDSRHILTAEHCVRGSTNNPTSFRVEFGDGSQETVWAVLAHNSADIAVLTINGIPASSNQKPIKVHTPSQGSITSGDRVIIAGAGRTSSTSFDSGTRRWGKIAFDSWVGDYTLSDSAGNVYNYTSGLRFEPEACVGDDPACSNVCNGDSGGPVYQWRPADGWGVIGVNSGAVCDGPGAMMFAADARAWRDFIVN